MRVNYLSADLPLSKTYQEIAPGTVKQNSYPHVANFTSIEKEIADLNEFAVVTTAAANEGLCLLKGLLDEPLIDESRAGHTNSKEPTSWICLDIDYTVTDVAITDFPAYLDPQFEDVSFLFQYSASQGIKNKTGWRGHFFFLLESPELPPALKQWLIHLNFISPLRPKIGLSAGGGALTFPLDVTTCQNDKLLYIAPPTCKNFDDPVKDRFELHEKAKPRLKLNLSQVSAAKNNVVKNQVLSELRKGQELPTKKFKTTQLGGLEILTNPDQVTVTGRKEERGFVYLNLNGGDSWAYYFPIDKPDILYNFKGEPAMYMKDVDPEIHAEFRLATDGFEPLVFNWSSTDTYYKCFSNQKTGEYHSLHTVLSKQKLKDFLKGNNVDVSNGWYVEDWQVTFDPSTIGRACHKTKTLNTYQGTRYIVRTPSKRSSIPPTINKVLESLCIDEEVKERFLNWLAFIFQTRQKTFTAWIFQGVQGTGKGVLYTEIITPLIGSRYCAEITMDRLSDDFNAYLAENIFLFIDEASIRDSVTSSKRLDRIKNLITEPAQYIRAMRTNPVLRDSFTNVVLATNHKEIIQIEESDRRFNIAPRQETPIRLDYDDILTIREELEEFADYLALYEVNERDVRTVISTQARQDLIELSKTSIDLFFEAIKKGDLGYFTQYLLANVTDVLSYQPFSKIVLSWVQHDDPLNHSKVSREELHVCYNYLQGSGATSPAKFSRICNKHGVHIKPMNVDGRTIRGIHVDWQLSVEERTSILGSLEKPRLVVHNEDKK